MQLQIYTVDAFADGPGSGNPAGVCLLLPEQLAGMTDALRQRVAAKVNLSETAFIEPVDPSTAGPDHFSTASLFKLRWFTPAVEVPLCGHATLASAAVIFAECNNPAPEVKLQTLSGLLVVKRAVDPQGQLLLQMSLPLVPPQEALPPSLTTELLHNGPESIGGAAPSRGLTSLLFPCLESLPAPEVAEQPHKQQPGNAPDWPSQWLDSVVQYVGYAPSLKYLLVVLKPWFGGKQLAALKPDVEAMAEAVPASELTGVIVAAAAGPGDDSNSGYDLYARFFGPWAGIEEDPVTGSAYTLVAPYFSNSVLGGKQQMLAKQCSARGGTLQLDLAVEPGRVVVSGKANMGPASMLDTDAL